MSIAAIRPGEDFIDEKLTELIDAANGERGPLVNMRSGTINALDYDTLALAVAAVTAGDTLLLPPGSSYTLSGNQTLDKAMTLIGYGATITGGGLYATAEDVTIQGVTVRNAPIVGIDVRRSRGRVIDCTVIDSASIGIFIETNALTNADIADCVVSGCRVDRTALGASVAEGGIKVHGYVSGSKTVTGTRITNNEVRMPESPVSNAAICIEVWGGSPYSVIANNTTFGGSMGVSIDRSDYSAATGNTSYKPSLIGYENALSAGVTISGNTLNGVGLTAKGISFSGSGSGASAISGNVLVGFLSRGIQVQTSALVTISGNALTASGGYGIDILSANGVAVSGNSLYGLGAGTRAIVADKSSNISINGNMFDDWTVRAITVFGDSAVTMDYINIFGNTYVNCPVAYATSLSGGAAIGSNVFVVTGYQGSAYTATNVTTDRAFDADTVLVAELADVVGTLIADLKAIGIVQ